MSDRYESYHTIIRYDLFGMSHKQSILKMESFAVFIQFSKLKIILVLHIYFFIVSTMAISCR